MFEEQQGSPGTGVEWSIVRASAFMLNQKGNPCIFLSRDLNCPGFWFKRVPGGWDGARIEQKNELGG